MFNQPPQPRKRGRYGWICNQIMLENNFLWVFFSKIYFASFVYIIKAALRADVLSLYKFSSLCFERFLYIHKPSEWVQICNISNCMFTQYYKMMLESYICFLFKFYCESGAARRSIVSNCTYQIYFENIFIFFRL